jgi:hypothetical protein
MSILIKRLFGKDMPMPQEGFVDIRIHFKSGKLKCVTMPTGEDPFYATFDVEKLPQHGRLIAEKTITEIRYHDADGYHIVNGEQLCELEIDADTVIEAEGREE